MISSSWPSRFKYFTLQLWIPNVLYARCSFNHWNAHVDIHDNTVFCSLRDNICQNLLNDRHALHVTMLCPGLSYRTQASTYIRGHFLMAWITDNHAMATNAGDNKCVMDTSIVYFCKCTRSRGILRMLVFLRNSSYQVQFNTISSHTHTLNFDGKMLMISNEAIRSRQATTWTVLCIILRIIFICPKITPRNYSLFAIKFDD